MRLLFMLMILPLSSSAMASLTIPEARKFCVQGESQLKNKCYRDALETSKKVLEDYPKSPKALSIYQSSIKKIGKNNQEAMSYLESAANLCTVLAIAQNKLDITRQILGEQLNNDINEMKRRSEEMNTIFVKLEEAGDLSGVGVQKTMNIGPGGAAVRVVDTQQRFIRKYRQDTEAAFRQSADDLSRFIDESNAKTDAILRIYEQNQNACKQLESRISFLSTLAIRSLVASENYAEALAIANKIPEFTKQRSPIPALLSDICNGTDFKLRGAPMLSKCLDSFIKDNQGGSDYEISLDTIKLNLITYYLDSHSNDEGGRDLSNYDFRFRNPEFKRFKYSDGQIINTGNGRVTKAVAASLKGSVFTGKWESLVFEDNSSSCKLPQENLCIFYQEGVRLYCERL